MSNEMYLEEKIVDIINVILSKRTGRDVKAILITTVADKNRLEVAVTSSFTNKDTKEMLVKLLNSINQEAVDTIGKTIGEV